MRLPRLPVSRRRHEAEVERRRHQEHDEWREFHCGQVRRWRERVAELRRERDEAQAQVERVTEIGREAIREREDMRARVAELEQAIRTFCRHHHEDELVQDRGEAKRRLCAVLDGQEGAPSRSGSPCRFEDAVRTHYDSFDGQSTDPRNTRLWQVLDRQERGDEPVTHQDGSGYLMNRRQPESTDVGPPDLPEPPPAGPDRDLIGHMEQPNPKPRRRRLGPDWQHLQGGWPR